MDGILEFFFTNKGNSRGGVEFLGGVVKRNIVKHNDGLRFLPLELDRIDEINKNKNSFDEIQEFEHLFIFPAKKSKGERVALKFQENSRIVTNPAIVSNLDLKKFNITEKIEVPEDCPELKEKLLTYFNTFQEIEVGDRFYYNFILHGFRMKMKISYQKATKMISPEPYFLIKAYRFQSQEMFQKVLTEKKEIER